MQTLVPSKQRGFTLLEVMVVIIIIGILAAIAYPSYLRYVRNARLQNAKTELALAQNMLEKYYAQNHRFRDASGVYPAEILTNISGNNKFFNVAFYNSDEAGSASNPGLSCNPTSANNDQYCLYAGPIDATNSGETRFLFTDATGVIQECEKGNATINASGVLTNKRNAVCSAN